MEAILARGTLVDAAKDLLRMVEVLCAPPPSYLSRSHQVALNDLVAEIQKQIQDAKNPDPDAGQQYGKFQSIRQNLEAYRQKLEEFQKEDDERVKGVMTRHTGAVAAATDLDPDHPPLSPMSGWSEALDDKEGLQVENAELKSENAKLRQENNELKQKNEEQAKKVLDLEQQLATLVKPPQERLAKKARLSVKESTPAVKAPAGEQSASNTPMTPAGEGSAGDTPMTPAEEEQDSAVEESASNTPKTLDFTQTFE
jgi:DNA repair exonuclease SbcCD ATPase subunit